MIIKKRIQTLDGLRGVAILMVILSHFLGTLPSGYDNWIWPVQWFANGIYGVQIFFVLSGYLITSILIREYDAIGRIDMKAFYCRRILRIFPAFYLFLFFIIGLNVAGVLHLPSLLLVFAGAHLLNYTKALTLLLGIPDLGGPDYHFVGHFWSLSMEEQFYWIWPLTLLFLLRTRWYGLLVVVILAMPLIRFGSYFLFPDLRGQLTMMLHSGSDAIFSGCLLAICLARHREFCKKLLLPSWAVAGLFLYIYVIDREINNHMPRGFAVTYGATLVIIAITLIVANALRDDGNNWYHWMLESRPLVYLGRISYSVYLWQQIFLTSDNTTFLGKCPINLLAAIFVGWLSYRFVELPFIRIKDRYFPPHTKAKPASVAPVGAVPNN